MSGESDNGEERELKDEYKNKEEDEEILQKLWKLLTESCDLHPSRDAGRVEISQQGRDTVHIRQGEGPVYVIGKSSMEAQYWNALQEWHVLEQSTVMPKGPPKGTALTRENKGGKYDEKEDEKTGKMSEDQVPVETQTKEKVKATVTKIEKISSLNPYKYSNQNPLPLENKTTSKTEERLDKQEKVIRDLANSVKAYVSSTTQTLEQTKKMLSDANEKLKIIDKMIKDLDRVVKLVTDEMNYDENGENNDEHNGRDKTETRITSGDTIVGKEDLREEVVKILNEKLQTSSKKDSKDEKDNSMKEFAKEFVETTLKLGMIAKVGHIQRDYKLDKDTKFEYFYELLTSELRSYELLHTINNTYPTELSDKMIEEQKFKARDIIINHLDKAYHSKVIQIKDPSKILEELKILKNSEINITPHAAKRAIWNLQYVMNKDSAVKFCEDFEDAVRLYENCPGANSINDEEKRDIFIGAIENSAPGIKYLDFMSQQTSGKRISYPNLKSLLIQEEASRKQAVSGEGTIRAANVARRALSRCFECGDLGHHGNKCAHKGEGPKCYNCNRFGHKSFECEDEKMNRKTRNFQGSRDNKTNNYQRGSGGTSKFKNFQKRKANDENPKGGKRGKYEGKGENHAQRNDRNNNDGGNKKNKD